MARSTTWLERRAGRKGYDPRIRVLTASAKRLDLKDSQEARQMRVFRQGWQSDAWSYRDSIGELRYAIQFLANCAARMRLFPAALPVSGETDDPMPVEEIEDMPDEVRALCSEAIRDLGHGKLALKGIMKSLSSNYSVAGEGYLLGMQDADTAEETWTIRSVDEIVVREDKYQLREIPSDPHGVVPWIDLDPENTVLTRIWAPHPRYRLLADSPMRAMLEDCESLLIMRRMIRAVGRSRLAGRGILKVPDGLSLKAPLDDNDDPLADPFMAGLAEAMMSPITDEGSSRAVVPIVVRGQAEALKELQHLDLASTFDTEASKTREELIGIIATSFDLPKEVVQGVVDLNHWSAWQVDDNTFRHHVEPHVIELCDSLTAAFLRPYLEEFGAHIPGIDMWIKRCVLWYDPTELVTHPDQTKDALDLHDRFVISDAALLRIAGFSDQEMPSKAEVQVRMIEKLRNWPPNLVMAFLHAWDPTLIAPAMTGPPAIPGIGPTGVESPPPAPAQAVPGRTAVPAGDAPAQLPPATDQSPIPAPERPLPAPPAVRAAGAEEAGTGVMVALYLPPALAQQFALDGGEPVDQLHVTLAFLGDAAELPDAEALQTLVAGWAAATAPLEGEISGVGLFTAGPEAVTYLSLDLPALPEARQVLADALERAGQPVSSTHGFTPHCTLDYADRTSEVVAGGEPVAFDSVAVVVGAERTDYPLTGSSEPPVTAAAPRPRAATTKSHRLSRRLMLIDRDLRAKLQVAANQAMLQQLERAGDRLRTKAAKDESMRALVAGQPRWQVGAALGRERVGAFGLEPEDLLGSEWKGLRSKFFEWGRAAQQQALETALRLSELDAGSEAAQTAQSALSEGLDAGWTLLAESMTHLSRSLLFEPGEEGAALADINPDTIVPTGIVRAALGVAGGAREDISKDPGGIRDVSLGAPVGQIGTGETIATLVEAAGGAREGYEWVHGPAIKPFEPHEALDGEQFGNFDADVLANNEDWPENAFLFPGDHQGCTCDFLPILLGPDEAASSEGDSDSEEPAE